MVYLDPYRGIALINETWLRETRAEVEIDSPARTALARRENVAIDPMQARLRVRAAQVARPCLDQAMGLGAAVREAHLKAVTRVAAISSHYDPKDPPTDAVLAVDDPNLWVNAADLSIPNPAPTRPPPVVAVSVIWEAPDG